MKNNNISYLETNPVHANQNNANSFSYKFKPYIVYNNSLLNKLNALKDNKEKSGIYRWVNKINNENYIGSSTNLTNRLRRYYSIKYLNKKILVDNSRIYKALLKYGYNNFNLEILEYCNKKSIINREQYYIDFLKPTYNILQKAKSSLGFKHSLETLFKFKDRDLGTGHIIIIVNKEDASIKKYNSIRAAAKDVGVSHPTLLNYINRNKLLKGIYLIISVMSRINTFGNKTELCSNIQNTKVNILDSSNNSIKEFSSIRSVANYIGIYYDIIISSTTISRYIKSGKLYKNKFYFYKINSKSDNS